MPSSTTQIVSESRLQDLLARLRLRIKDPSAGIFGADSISWKINRESALFLAAGRAALLQLAHPWVATAIAQHSRTLHDPIGRFHQTFRVMFTMVFGTVEQACAAARQLHRRHQNISGDLPETTGCFTHGTHYEANDLPALIWVYATLVDSALLAYELVLPPLGDAEREQYYWESRQTAALFGIAGEDLPQDWASFRGYMEAAVRSDTLGVSATTRELAHRLRDGAGLKLRPPFWYGALTTELLPPRFREEFQFTYGAREHSSAQRALRWLRRAYSRLPAVLRFVGPYNEVLSRQKGRAPSLPVRCSNHLWIGQSSLLAAPQRLPKGS